MRPADHGPRGTLAGSLRVTPGNTPGSWKQENESGQQFYSRSGISTAQQSMPFPSSAAIPTNLPGLAGQNSQMDFSSLQGIQFSALSGITVPGQSFAHGSQPAGLTMNFASGPRFGYSAHGASVGRPGADIATQEQSVEERKRLEHQRQQTKMRQSFEASKNKNLKPDDLMGKIIADFGPLPPKSVAKITTDQREVQSRPSTPHASPVAALHRDRSGSLNISPQNSARLQEPLSDPTPNSAAPKSSLEQRSKIPDLSDLMMKFSDLSTSGGPVRMNFSAAQVKNQPLASARNTAFFNDSQSAVDWKSVSSDLASAFSAVPAAGTGDSSATAAIQPDLPPWCSDMNSLPNVYRGVVGLFKNQLFLPKSAIFPVLTRSGLGLKTLEHIWSATCRTKVDFLSRSELCAALGLIGLAQTNFDVAHLTVDVLRRIPNPPEPFFVSSSPPPQIVQPAVQVVSSEQIFGVEFQNIPLNFSAAKPVPSVGHNEEEEFADFVSAPTPQASKTSSKPEIPLIFPKPEAATVKKSVALQRRWENEGNNSTAPTVEDPAWGDWAHQAESFDRNVQKIPAVTSSVQLQFPQSTPDPYSALRNLPVVAPQGHSEINSTHFADWSSSSAAEFHPASPPSGDDLSLQSLDFGGPTVVSDGDLALVSVDEVLSLANSDSVPNLVLDNLEVSSETNGDDFQNDTGSGIELEHAEVWIRALHACAELIEEACGVFNSVDNSAMLVKVLAKARDHIQNLMEVYRVARRIYIGAKSFGSMDDQRVVDAIKETEESWTDFMAFLSMAAMEPQAGSMDFSKADLSAQNPPNSSVCGVCLLDVDAESRARKSQMDGRKIKHEDRFYHAICANFWVNCVDVRLPRLTYKS